MEEIKFISHNIVDSIDYLKSLALYYDKIRVSDHIRIFAEVPANSRPGQKVKGKIISKSYFTEDTFRQHIKLFEDANLVSFDKDFYYPEKGDGKTFSPGDPNLDLGIIILFYAKDLLWQNPKIETKKNADGTEDILIDGDTHIFSII